jgi:hypothetical protein
MSKKALWSQLLVVISTLLAASAASAESVIYQHNFAGDAASSLNGQSPDTASGTHGGVSDVTWNSHARLKADGSIGTSAGTGASAFLPFKPLSGYIYTISVDTQAKAVANNPTTTLSYVGVGLYNGTPNPEGAVGGGPVISPIGRSPDNTANALSSEGPFQILRRWHRSNPTGGSATLQANHLGTLGTDAGTWRLSIKLDTTNPADWKYRWLTEDVTTSTLLSETAWTSLGALGANPITSVQLFNEGPLSSGSFDNFLVTVEDPSTLIYSHDFTGQAADALHNVALDVATGGLGSSSATTWRSNTGIKADGSVASVATGMSAFVPFSPVDGQIYTISVDTTSLPIATSPTTTLSYIGLSLHNNVPQLSAAVGGQHVIAPIVRSPDHTPNAGSSAGPFQILRRWHRDTPSTDNTSLTQDHLGTLGTNAGKWRLTIQLNTANPGGWQYRWMVEEVETGTVISRSVSDGQPWRSLGSLGSRPITSIVLLNQGQLASGSFGAFRVSAVPMAPLPVPDPVVVDAAYPGGNIRVLSTSQTSGGPRIGTLAPDQRHMQSGQQWFYWSFRTKDTAGFTAAFQNRDHVGPRGAAVSHDEGKTWSYMGPSSVVQQTVNGASCWTFTVPPVAEGAEVRYAFCPQYQQSHFDDWVSRQNGNPHLEVTELTRSRNDRKVELVRIGRPLTDTDAKVVLLTARHHSCEVIGSYVMEGFLDAALADDELGARLRKRTILAVPFVDKDGVEEGDQGKNRAPHDHNRDYNEVPIYPEVAAIKQLGAQVGARTASFIDLHCPTVHGFWDKRVYFVGAPEADVAANQRAFHTRIMELRQGPLTIVPEDYLPFGQDWNTNANYSQGKNSSAWARETFPNSRYISTIEISYSVVNGVEMTAERARALGADLARTLAPHILSTYAGDDPAKLWQVEHFQEDAENPAVFSWTADNDQDGVTNLAEYAFNQSPLEPSVITLEEATGTSGLPSIRTVEAPSGKVLRIEYLRRKASVDPGISYLPQISESLVVDGPEGWRGTTAAEQVTSVDDAWERVVIEEPSEVPARFARVFVSRD